VAAASHNWLPILVYVAVFTVVGSAVDLVDLDWLEGLPGLTDTLVTVQGFAGLGYGLAGMLLFLATLFGQYLLWEAMLRNSGFAGGLGRHRYLAFVGLSLVVLLGTMLGYLLLVIPGLVFSARWTIAPALLVRSDLGVIESMRRSWNAISGNSTPVVLVMLAGGLVILLVAVVIGGTSVFVGDEAVIANPLPVVVGQLVGQFQVVLGVAMGLFLYGKLHDHSGELVEVFA
jgi:uncharacterized membrane protein